MDGRQQIGAGTGQFARPLIDAGADLTAIEPMPTPHSGLVAANGAHGHVLDGTAERLPVGDGSADLVTAADSFHWFDPHRALPEIRRILPQGGRFAVCRLVPPWNPEECADWAAELGAVVEPIWSESRPPLDRASTPAVAVVAAHGFANPRTEELAFKHHTDRAGVHSLFMSMSFVGALAAEQRAAVAAQLDEVLERHQVGNVQPTYIARLWATTRS